MEKKYQGIISAIQQSTGSDPCEILELYPGIALSFSSVSEKDAFHICHEPLAQILEINYCIAGKISWNMGSGKQVYLGPGDFSLNTMDVCEDSTVTLPNRFYEGLTIYIDLEQLSEHPPAPLADAHITGELLKNKYCKDGLCTALAGNETMQKIFQALYLPAEEIRLAYQKIKVLELLLVLSQMEIDREKHLTEYRAEQVEIIRQIHDLLTSNLDQRCSIETLSRQYLMNPTTLKRMFKAIYGTSIAAHIREHRMEHAAQLLRSSDLSIADIALKVGYDSQSRFSSVFKEYYQMLPKEYRRKYSNGVFGSGETNLQVSGVRSHT